VKIMIGKAEWFTTRKFGWGLGVKTREGVIYVIGILALLALISILPIDGDLKFMSSGILIGLVILDTAHIMVQIHSNLDEREQKHQMLAETVASYIGILSLSVFLIYLILVSPNHRPDWNIIGPIIAILLAMSFAKGITLFWAQRKW
jgi:Kef-type K+ transport system membrane component KefB